MQRSNPLSQLAKAGFSNLNTASERIDELKTFTGVSRDDLLTCLGDAADPDRALGHLLDIARTNSRVLTIANFRSNEHLRNALAKVLGTSNGLAEFLKREPEYIETLSSREQRLLKDAQTYRTLMLSSVGASSDDNQPIATSDDEAAWVLLRRQYRRLLIDICEFDLFAKSATEVFPEVARALSDLAGATLEAGLAVARRTVTLDSGVGKKFTAEQVALTRLAVIAMGKCGAQELNYVSDVDVIFVAETADESILSQDNAIACATRIASEMMRAIHDPANEPALWQVDPNLRPEGKQGPLVRTLASHLAYYDRWAKSWEFQALLKARVVAGDRELGEAYVSATRPLVWTSASRANFVDSARNMRERVMQNIPVGEVEFQIKLGPGGLRDVEFTVQLLQLVHGQQSEAIRSAATLTAIDELSVGGFIARADAAELSEAYRRLRVIEHRLQLRDLRRTALVPNNPEDLRWLARASAIGSNSEEFVHIWEATKERVRQLHLKIFYAPLLLAAAAVGEAGTTLTGEQAADRLRAIGFKDAAGALVHIAALSKGMSRRATIQRNLLPVILAWLSEGADPDYGLLSFRRVSDSLADTPWYLRLLRDGSGAALRLSQLLSGSKFVGELLESIPEAVSWLEGDEDLMPSSQAELTDELAALTRRHVPIRTAMPHLLQVRRREVLRLAMGSLTGVLAIEQVSVGLSNLYRALLSVVLEAIRDELSSEDFPGARGGTEFAIVEVGRFGGGELSLSSDLDLMYVYRDTGAGKESAGKFAEKIASEFSLLLVDPKIPLEIDLGLRPEGRSGPRVRSLDSYRAYYERWSLTWEAQALLRARCAIGDANLCANFTELADEIRYPTQLTDDQIREIRRLKARVEAERLPQGADPTRHLKLGKGSISDVEWLVQLLQLRHAVEHPSLRVQSTMQALESAAALGLIGREDEVMLREAWMLASSLRTAYLLWANRSSDILPTDRNDLEGVARILGYGTGMTSQLEQDYLATTRRARAIFERDFFGFNPEEPARYSIENL